MSSTWPDAKIFTCYGYYYPEQLTLIAEPLPHIEFLFHSGYFQPFLDKYDADFPF